jgi:hypothetical protein
MKMAQDEWTLGQQTAESYLRTHFPEPDHRLVWEHKDAIFYFTITGDRAYFLEISEEFLADHTAEEIEGLLANWQVAELFRSGAKRIRLTNAGCTPLEQYGS